MKKLIIILIVVLIVIIAGIWIYKAKKASEAQEPLVIIHQGSWFGDAPFYLAQAKGFFEKYGVRVEIQKVEETQARRQLLSSGRADISAETIDMAVLDIGAGVEEKIFMALDTSLGADGIVATEEIKTISDLKGKKVGATKGDPPYFLLKYLMKEYGISSDEVIFQDMPNADTAGTAFISGELDAAGTWEPWLSKASERVGGHVLVSSKDAPGIIVDVAIARPEVLQERKAEVVAAMKAWFDAIDYWRENPQEANEIMAKEFNLQPDEFASLIETIRWDDKNSNLSYFGTLENKGKVFEVTQKIIDIAGEEGMISRGFSSEEIIDLNVLKEIK
jgi:NitT/TauT family transport system substrate-binding protein